MDATFYFDPACSWTWRTARWLVTVAGTRNLTIEWRAFSLAILNEGQEPTEHAAAFAAAHRALRLVEALHAERRGDEAARFYAAMGARSHDAGNPLTDEIVASAARGAALGPITTALDDPGWDDAVRGSHERAYASAGPDVGSPVLLLPGVARGVHGPILTEVPGTRDALALWDALQPMLRLSSFHELKRGRR